MKSDTNSFSAFGRLAASYVKARAGRIDGSLPGNPVRSHSYDVDDPRANEHRPIGDGSSGQLWAFREATIESLEKWRAQLIADQYDGLYMIEFSTIAVAKALVYSIKRQTGKCTPSKESLAKDATVSPRTAERAIEVLEHWGFFAHVRRSTRVDAPEGQAGPRHRQVSNSYVPNCGAMVDAKLSSIFWDALERNMKRLSGVAKKHVARMRVSLRATVQRPPRRPRQDAKLHLPAFATPGLAAAFGDMWQTLNRPSVGSSSVAAAVA